MTMIHAHSKKSQQASQETSRYHFSIRFFAVFLSLTFGLQEISLAAPLASPQALAPAVTPMPPMSFKLPESVATIEDGYVAPKATKTIFLLQDAHTNESGQMNAAKALERILPSEKISYVFTEGANRDASLSFLKEFFPQDALREASVSFVRKGILKGGEFANLNGEYPFTLWGVEDPALYDQSLEKFVSVMRRRDKAAAYLDHIERSAGTLKEEIYRASLKALDAQAQSHRNGDLGLTDYFAALKKSARKTGVSLATYPHLSLLNDLKKMESKIDFTRVAKEQEAAIRTLSAENQRALSEASKTKHSPFRMGGEDKATERAFYALLAENLTAAGQAKTFPELFKYFRYLTESHKLNAKETLGELADFESDVFDALTQTNDERLLYRLSKNLITLQSLLEMKLAPQDFENYKADAMAFNVRLIGGFFNRKIQELDRHYDRAVLIEEDYEEVVKAAADFYELALARDNAFLQNMTRKMDEEGITKAVLVTGGYHTPSLKRLFQEQGISYVTILPQILHETDTQRYEKMVHQQFAAAHKETRYAVRSKVTANTLMLNDVRDSEYLGPLVTTAAQIAFPSDDTRFKKAVSQAMAVAKQPVRRLAYAGPVNRLEARRIEADQTYARSIELSKTLPALAGARLAQEAFDRRNERIGVSRRFFLKASAAAVAGIANPSSLLAQAVPAAPFQLNAKQIQALTQFLANNRTKSGMPLSYKVVNPRDWKKIGGNDAAGIQERLLLAYTANIYDAAAGQIALTLNGRSDLADSMTKRLLSGKSGALATIRAYKDPFRYGDAEEEMGEDNAFFFRMFGDQYLMTDPLDGKDEFENFPNFPKLHHEDWMPIAGENAWAAIIGPIQTAQLKYQGKIPFDANELELALSILPAIQAMQSPIGGIYHAPLGTFGKSAREISNENNFSMYAALRMLKQALEPHKNQTGVAQKIADISKIMSGMEDYFKKYAFDAENGVFYQGGMYRDGKFTPSADFAVDCQTWAILTLGPEWINREIGKGNERLAADIWVKTRERAGYKKGGELHGVGFSDGHDVLSSEWTFGAIMATKILSGYYQTLAGKENNQTSKKAYTGRAALAAQDALSMRRGVEALAQTLPDGSLAYLYSNKRHYIIFGWWANPIPSAAGSNWALLDALNFNPFVLGGGAQIQVAQTAPSAPSSAPKSSKPKKEVVAETLTATGQYGQGDDLPQGYLTWFNKPEKPITDFAPYTSAKAIIHPKKGDKAFQVLLMIQGEGFGRYYQKITVPEKNVRAGEAFEVQIPMKDIVKALTDGGKRRPQIREVHFSEGVQFHDQDVNPGDNTEKFDIDNGGVPELQLMSGARMAYLNPEDLSDEQRELIVRVATELQRQARGIAGTDIVLTITGMQDKGPRSRVIRQVFSQNGIPSSIVEFHQLSRTKSAEMTSIAAYIGGYIDTGKIGGARLAIRVTDDYGDVTSWDAVARKARELFDQGQINGFAPVSLDEFRLLTDPGSQSNSALAFGTILQGNGRGSLGEKYFEMLLEITPKLYEDNTHFHLVRTSMPVKGLPGTDAIQSFVVVYMKDDETYSAPQPKERTGPSFSRKIDESFVVGQNIRVTLIRIDGNQVRFRVEAPKNVSIKTSVEYDRAREDETPLVPQELENDTTHSSRTLKINFNKSRGKDEESIVIGDDDDELVEVFVDQIKSRNSVQVTILAPSDMRILRSELLEGAGARLVVRETNAPAFENMNEPWAASIPGFTAHPSYLREFQEKVEFLLQLLQKENSSWFVGFQLNQIFESYVDAMNQQIPSSEEPRESGTSDESNVERDLDKALGELRQLLHRRSLDSQTKERLRTLIETPTEYSNPSPRRSYRKILDSMRRLWDLSTLTSQEVAGILQEVLDLDYSTAVELLKPLIFPFINIEDPEKRQALYQPKDSEGRLASDRNAAVSDMLRQAEPILRRGILDLRVDTRQKLMLDPVVAAFLATDPKDPAGARMAWVRTLREGGKLLINGNIHVSVTRFNHTAQSVRIATNAPSEVAVDGEETYLQRRDAGEKTVPVNKFYDDGNLVMTRKIGESIVVQIPTSVAKPGQIVPMDKVRITAIGMKGQKVRLAVEAPRHISLREGARLVEDDMYTTLTWLEMLVARELNAESTRGDANVLAGLERYESVLRQLDSQLTGMLMIDVAQQDTRSDFAKLLRLADALEDATNFIFQSREGGVASIGNSNFANLLAAGYRVDVIGSLADQAAESIRRYYEEIDASGEAAIGETGELNLPPILRLAVGEFVELWAELEKADSIDETISLDSLIAALDALEENRPSRIPSTLLQGKWNGLSGILLAQEPSARRETIEIVKNYFTEQHDVIESASIAAILDSTVRLLGRSPAVEMDTDSNGYLANAKKALEETGAGARLVGTGDARDSEVARETAIQSVQTFLNRNHRFSFERIMRFVRTNSISVLSEDEVRAMILESGYVPFRFNETPHNEIYISRNAKRAVNPGTNGLGRALIDTLNDNGVGVWINSVSVQQLKGDPLTDAQIFDAPTIYTLGTSIVQALGSFQFAGQGKSVKEIADASAVYLGEANLRRTTGENHNMAVVILGDEGSRDNSASLQMGSIYFKGKKISFRSLQGLKAQVEFFRQAGIQVFFQVSDALENTNGLVVEEARTTATNSTSLVALFQGWNDYLMPDDLRMGGISYNAPRDAGVGVFDLPSVALPKIALASGLKENTEAFDKFMNTRIVLSLGPRNLDLEKPGYSNAIESHRHRAIMADALELKKKYPGLKTVFPGDGDALPRVVATLGLDLNGHQMVVFGRSGFAEFAASTLAGNAADGQFSETIVAADATNSDFSAAPAHSYTDGEIAALESAGVPKEVYEAFRTKKDRIAPGTLAFTSVTGAAEAIFGKGFAKEFRGIRIYGNQIITSTLLVTPDGSTFIVRTRFETADAEKALGVLRSLGENARRAYLDPQTNGQQGARLTQPTLQAAPTPPADTLSTKDKNLLRAFAYNLARTHSSRKEDLKFAFLLEKGLAIAAARLADGRLVLRIGESEPLSWSYDETADWIKRAEAVKYAKDAKRMAKSLQIWQEDLAEMLAAINQTQILDMRYRIPEFSTLFSQGVKPSEKILHVELFLAGARLAAKTSAARGHKMVFHMSADRDKEIDERIREAVRTDGQHITLDAPPTDRLVNTWYVAKNGRVQNDANLRLSRLPRGRFARWLRGITLGFVIIEGTVTNPGAQPQELKKEYAKAQQITPAAYERISASIGGKISRGLMLKKLQGKIPFSIRQTLRSLFVRVSEMMSHMQQIIHETATKA